jgi:hypothetical protein
MWPDRGSSTRSASCGSAAAIRSTCGGGVRRSRPPPSTSVGTVSDAIASARSRRDSVRPKPARTSRRHASTISWQKETCAGVADGDSATYWTARMLTGEAGGSGPLALRKTPPATALARLIPAGSLKISDWSIRSPMPVLSSAAPAARSSTSRGNRPAHATIDIAPSEWPASSALRPAGTVASSTACRSSASASVEKSASAGSPLSPWPRRS